MFIQNVFKKDIFDQTDAWMTFKKSPIEENIDFATIWNCSGNLQRVLAITKNFQSSFSNKTFHTYNIPLKFYLRKSLVN